MVPAHKTASSTHCRWGENASHLFLSHLTSYVDLFLFRTTPSLAHLSFPIKKPSWKQGSQSGSFPNCAEARLLSGPLILEEAFWLLRACSLGLSCSPPEMSGRLCAGKLRGLAIQTFPERRRIRDEKACKIYRIESEVGNRFLPALLGLRASQRAQQIGGTITGNRYVP